MACRTVQLLLPILKKISQIITQQRLWLTIAMTLDQTMKGKLSVTVPLYIVLLQWKAPLENEVIRPLMRQGAEVFWLVRVSILAKRNQSMFVISHQLVSCFISSQKHSLGNLFCHERQGSYSGNCALIFHLTNLKNIIYKLATRYMLPATVLLT